MLVIAYVGCKSKSLLCSWSAVLMIALSKLPADPVNGRPCMSSHCDGASPRNRKSQGVHPLARQTCLRVWWSLQSVQVDHLAKWSWTAGSTSWSDMIGRLVICFFWLPQIFWKRGRGEFVRTLLDVLLLIRDIGTSNVGQSNRFRLRGSAWCARCRCLLYFGVLRFYYRIRIHQVQQLPFV